MGAARAGVRDVILRDGTTLRLRRSMRDDEHAVVDFFRRLSDYSLYLRFHGLPSVTPALVESFLCPDGVEEETLLGSLVDRGGERIVALASWARLRDPRAAEVAFAVDDDMQGKGVGTRLLEQLAELAAEQGVESFVAEVLPENRAMLGVFADAGFDVTRAVERGGVEVRFPIKPSESYRRRVDLRDHVAVVASLSPFFEPASVAVVGASPKEGSIGAKLFSNIIDGGFRGAAYPINRSGVAVKGVPAVRSLSEIAKPIDLVVLCVPAPAVLEAAREALELGTRGLCVISAGFAETGREGATRQEQLLALVRSHGARLLGPNCLGLAVADVALNATFARESFPPGPIGFVSQSGALGLALLEAAETRGLGFSSFVSIGNKADVSSNDVLEYWEDDPKTQVVLLYLESFGNPAKFARLAQRVARRKPLLALKSGISRSGARAASSHTAALAGSETAVNALFHHAGVIRAATLEELLDVAALYSSGAAPKGRRVGVLTNAGGLGILCADACEAAELELPQLTRATKDRLAVFLPSEASIANPVDMLGTATPSSYEQALSLLLADPGIDSVIVLFVPAATVEADDVAAAISRAARADTTGKPLLAVVMTSVGIPPALVASADRVAPFAYPESAARALGKAADRADWLRRRAGVLPQLTGIDVSGARAIVSEVLAESTDAWLDAVRGRRLLECFGIPLVPERVVENVEQALHAARALGFPVVVKTAIPGVHKTDVGGVVLDLADELGVRQAAERIGGPLLVQPMVRGGTELLAGLVQDPVFGPLVAFGPGGKLAELIGDASFRIAPLTDADAAELVLSGKAGRLVRGFRGAPASDVQALTDLVHRLSRLGEELAEVVELDLNPVLGLPQGCLVLDTRMRLRGAEPAHQPKTW